VSARTIGWAASVFFAGLVACSGSSSSSSGNTGSASLAGSIQGASAFAAADAIALVRTIDEANNTTVSTWYVLITSRAGTCNLITASYGEQLGNMGELELTIGAQMDMAAGMYPITISNVGTAVASATYATSDASCNTVTAGVATGGTVNVTTASDALVEGTFHLVFAGGDELTGSFHAPACDVSISEDAAAPSPGPGPPVCVAQPG